jgi:hypothetical protein
VLVTWHTSPTKTLADLMRCETVIGSPLALREPVRRAIQPANAKEIPGKPGGNE